MFEYQFCFLETRLKATMSLNFFKYIRYDKLKKACIVSIDRLKKMNFFLFLLILYFGSSIASVQPQTSVKGFSQNIFLSQKSHFEGQTFRKVQIDASYVETLNEGRPQFSCKSPVDCGIACDARSSDCQAFYNDGNTCYLFKVYSISSILRYKLCFSRLILY